MAYKFKLKEKVIIVCENSFFKGDIGTVIKRSNYDFKRYDVDVDTEFGKHRLTYFESNLEPLDYELAREIKELEKERIRKKEELEKERIRKKEQLRLKYIHIDPYGEEEWEE